MAFVKSDFGVYKTTFVVAVTATNQIAMSIDLSPYASTSGWGGVCFMVFIATLNITPRARVASIWYVEANSDDADNSWSLHRQSSIVAPLDAFVDFIINVDGHTLQTRIDGGAVEATPVMIVFEGLMGQAL